jgi:hypothetical protein
VTSQGAAQGPPGAEQGSAGGGGSPRESESVRVLTCCHFIAPSHPHTEVTKLLCPHHEGAGTCRRALLLLQLPSCEAGQAADARAAAIAAGTERQAGLRLVAGVQEPCLRLAARVPVHPSSRGVIPSVRMPLVAGSLRGYPVGARSNGQATGARGAMGSAAGSATGSLSTTAGSATGSLSTRHGQEHRKRRTATAQGRTPPQQRQQAQSNILQQ